MGLYVEEQLIGFTINEPNYAEYVNCLFAHTETSYVGASGLLYQQTGILLLEEGHRYLNMQTDMGLRGLQLLKLSLNPTFFLKKWLISVH